jgi:signal transduction histidine kinase
MLYLYLIYGATFVVAGALLGLQARLPSSVVPKAALWWFSGFAVLHGFSEWALIVAIHPDASSIAQQSIEAIALCTASYALLAQFAVVILRTTRRWPRWTYAVSGSLLISWIGTVVTASMTVGLTDTALRVLDAASRYAFAIPASLLAAHALWSLRRDRSEGDVIRRCLGWTSGVFVAYAIFAGVIVPPAPFFPASTLSSSAFIAVMHVPVEVVRTACALGIAVLLSQALVIETARQHRELERRREEFISVVAHDLRNPLSTMLMSITLLEERLVELNGAARQGSAKLCQHIRTGIHGLERMVRDLLDASRIEARKLALEPRDVDLRSLVSGIVERARQATEGHAVKLVLPEELPETHADPMRVEQILGNLLSNAAKYSGAGTDIRVEATVRVDEVELAVTNEGPGLSAEDSELVFSRFYRSARHSRSVDGLGLGLYIAKGLVEAQGGRIWADSELGSYTTFRFTLPRVGVRQAITSTGAQQSDGTG